MVTRESTKWRKLIAEKRYIVGWRLRVYLLVRAATIILRLPGKVVRAYGRCNLST